VGVNLVLYTTTEPKIYSNRNDFHVSILIRVSQPALLALISKLHRSMQATLADLGIHFTRVNKITKYNDFFFLFIYYIFIIIW
jgi:hypothetical protein